ncbi:MAG: tetratricopeptide repeat protein [Dysgonamonadaceae bacterium]|jgi:tetratricopeptide (TPR) repeat protein|nr:tetratricopeptide repeat protein [Dysgonamonadaceae bacterium]
MNKIAVFMTLLLSVNTVSAQTDSGAIERSFDYIEQNKLDSAEIYLKLAIESVPDNPLNPFLLNNLGTVQRRLGKKTDAVNSYSAALEQLPENTVFLEARASLYAETGRTENAIHDYSALLEQNPANEEFLYQRGLLYLQAGQDNYAEADFRKMLELNPDGFYPRLGLAALAKFREDYAEAEKIYSFLLDKYPENPQLYAGRAELFLLSGKAGKASADATRAIRISTEGNPYYYVIRYRAKLLLHEDLSAREDLEKAKALGYQDSSGQAL